MYKIGNAKENSIKKKYKSIFADFCFFIVYAGYLFIFLQNKKKKFYKSKKETIIKQTSLIYTIIHKNNSLQHS